MYNVNIARIDEVLIHMQRMLDVMEQLLAKTDGAIQHDLVATLAMERAFHLCLEAIADVGNALIDGFIMRDPGSYTDIVEILRDERVIDNQQAEQLTAAVTFRKHLVNDYTQVPVSEMIRLVRQSLNSLTQFGPAVRVYLQKELF